MIKALELINELSASGNNFVYARYRSKYLKVKQVTTQQSEAISEDICVIELEDYELDREKEALVKSWNDLKRTGTTSRMLELEELMKKGAIHNK